MGQAVDEARHTSALPLLLVVVTLNGAMEGISLDTIFAEAAKLGPEFAQVC